MYPPRDSFAVFFQEIIRLEMTLDFLETAAGCAALGVNMVYTIDVRELPEVKSNRKTEMELVLFWRLCLPYSKVNWRGPLFLETSLSSVT